MNFPVSTIRSLILLEFVPSDVSIFSFVRSLGLNPNFSLRWNLKNSSPSPSRSISQLIRLVFRKLSLDSSQFSFSLKFSSSSEFLSPTSDFFQIFSSLNFPSSIRFSYSLTPSNNFPPVDAFVKVRPPGSGRISLVAPPVADPIEAVEWIEDKNSSPENEKISDRRARKRFLLEGLSKISRDFNESTRGFSELLVRNENSNDFSVRNENQKKKRKISDRNNESTPDENFNIVNNLISNSSSDLMNFSSPARFPLVEPDEFEFSIPTLPQLGSITTTRDQDQNQDHNEDQRILSPMPLNFDSNSSHSKVVDPLLDRWIRSIDSELTGDGPTNRLEEIEILDSSDQHKN